MSITENGSADLAGRARRLVVFEPRNVWRTGLVVIGLVALGLFLKFLIDDGGSTIFTLLMAWFASIAMEPAVRRLAGHMPRGLATALVMFGVVLSAILFFALFGRLLVDQIAQLVTSIPDLLNGVLDWVNKRFGTNYSAQSLLEQLNITPAKIASWASEIAGGLIGFLGSVLGSVFGVFTFALFTFYLSADGPRLRRWLGRLFPARLQGVFATTWDLAIEKTGGYVAARVILATINGSTTAIFLWIIGMPYWLPLGIWTGIVAQFVPTIGTYIAIALPAIVGLLSPDPIDGVLALVWGVAYQQVENLTLEPRISARAVDVHPAVSFGSVMLGAALFGVAGALLAIPVSALLLTLADIYGHKYELIPQLVADAGASPAPPGPAPDAGDGDGDADRPEADPEPAPAT